MAQRYDLHVSFGISGEGIAVEQTSVPTRIRQIGSASWTLNAQDSARSLLSSGSARAVDGMNLFDSQYFAADLENSAVTQRLADALADQIALQLAAYFRKRGAG